MGSVVNTTSTAKGFDVTGRVITGAYAACLAANYGMSSVGRDASLTATEASTDLSSPEDVAITEDGPAILVAQHLQEVADVSA
ncbi:MAG TPA: hypothetical protein VIJ40_04190 [Acidimicrobiales bacterium]